MKKSLKLAALISTAAVLSACGTVGGKPEAGYAVSPSGSVVKSGAGLCWRTATWTKEQGTVECGDALPPAPAPVAAAPAPAPAPAPARAAVVAPAAPTNEKVTYAADAFFDFDKSVLKPEGKAKLDELVSKLNGVNLEVIIAVGHTDSVGTDAYNQKLSVRRADAVKTYLIGKGVETNRIYTEGKGEKQPIADNKTEEGRAKNRRVEIEVVGTRPVKK
ncbi:outer membrane protein OmpA [Derxia lacustris]|uniref:outer membrane protein OmpA n=1 Tax=Derxia lacustris TaxID=764842 RepID=UPI000A16F12E|nr:OmpA family protein [Derxia lacustris]